MGIMTPMAKELGIKRLPVAPAWVPPPPQCATAQPSAWPGITHTRTTPAYMAVLLAMPEGSFPYLPDMQLTVVSGGLTPAMARETQVV